VRLVPQLGVSRYRLDFAVKDPDRPGRYLLAIECDGASYHSAPTARDRDRLRQQQLESLGWRIHRIWSTDWFNHRARELLRCLEAIEQARLAVVSVPEAPKPPQTPSTAPTVNEADAATTASKAPSTPKPVWPPRTWTTIDQVPRTVLASVVAWATSDGLLRTDDQIVQLVATELGFQRSGARIRAVILEALAASRPS
jgi:very-short-patch-repair endonuclease